MYKIYTEASIRNLFILLDKYPEHIIWNLVEDVSYNGHHIIFQSSQYRHVIVDGTVHSVSRSLPVQSKGINYPTSLDFVMHLLSIPKED